MFTCRRLADRRIGRNVRAEFVGRIVAEYHVDLGSARSFGIRVQWMSWFWYWAVKGIPLLRTCDASAAIMCLQLDFLSAGEKVANGGGVASVWIICLISLSNNWRQFKIL